MIINVHKDLEGPMGVIEKFIKRDAGLERALTGTEITLGPASDPRYQTPLSAARREAVYVGDASYVADARHIIAAPDVMEMAKKDLSKVDTRFVWDDRMGKYRLFAQKRRFVSDGIAIADAAPDFLGAQALSPWNVGWFQQIFKAGAKDRERRFEFMAYCGNQVIFDLIHQTHTCNVFKNDGSTKRNLVFITQKHNARHEIVIALIEAQRHSVFKKSGEIVFA